MERGLITLIGATTENPQFACNAALVSRSTLMRVEPLSVDDVAALVRRAVTDPERGFGARDIRIDDDAVRVWAVKSDGDARRALTALEVAVLSADENQPIVIDRAVAEDSIQQKAAVYDGAGDEHFERDVAIKIAELSGDESARSETMRRFASEAQLTGQLEHPSIVPVYDFGTLDEDRAWFAMRLVRGRSLRQLIDQLLRDSESRVEWPLQRRLGVVLRVCDALAYAHSRGVVHRDLKPGNVMVGPFGEVQVMDWGLAKFRGEEDSRGREQNEATEASDTASGKGFGTPSYMAPEQTRQATEPIDARTDVFGLGALLWHFVSGNLPNRGDDPAQVAEQAARGKGVDLRLESARLGRVPREVAAICRKAMAPHQEDRYAGALELAADLEAYRGDEPGAAWKDSPAIKVRKWRRRRPVAATVLLSVVALGASLGIAAWLLAVNARLEREQRFDDLVQRLPEVVHRTLAMNDAGRIDSGAAINAHLEAFAAAGLPLDGSLSVDEWNERASEAELVAPGYPEKIREGLYDLAHEVAIENALSGGEVRLFERLDQLLLATEPNDLHREAWIACRECSEGNIDDLLEFLRGEGHQSLEGRALFRSARLLESTSHRGEAVPLYERALDQEPALFWAHMLLGNRYGTAGDWDRAVSHYLQARVIDSQAPGPLTNLCTAHHELKAFPAAIRAGEKAVDVAPDSARAHYNLGIALGDSSILLKRTEYRGRATLHFERAVELDRGHRRAWQQFVISLYLERRFDEAITVAGEALDDWPQDGEIMKALSAAHWSSMKEFGDASHGLALDWIRRACFHTPQDRSAFPRAAILLGRSGLVEAALLYRRAELDRFATGKKIILSLERELQLLSRESEPTNTDECMRLAFRHLSRLEPRAAVEWFRLAFVIEDGLESIRQVLVGDDWPGVDLVTFIHNAARQAARSSLDLGYAHDPSVAVLDDLDVWLLEQHGADLALDRVRPAERASLASLDDDVRDEHAELGVHWLVECLALHWASTAPRNQSVVALLSAGDLRELLADGWTEMFLEQLNSIDPDLAGTAREALR